LATANDFSKLNRVITLLTHYIGGHCNQSSVCIGLLANLWAAGERLTNLYQIWYEDFRGAKFKVTSETSVKSDCLTK